MNSNPTMELASFFLLLNLLQANATFQTFENNELIHQKHHPIIRHNNPLFNRAFEFHKIVPKLPIKKLPLKEMATIAPHQQEQQKRLTLYPTMVELDEKTLVATPSNKTPRKSSHNSWQKHRRPMHWLGHRGETMALSNNGQKQENDGNDGTQKHELSCLFLRSGCHQKIQHNGHRRLASFVQNLDVQERITNGFVLHRQNSKKKKFRRSRLLR